MNKKVRKVVGAEAKEAFERSDGHGWRLHISAPFRDTVTLTIERVNDEIWLPVQRWQVDLPEGANRRVVIADSCRDHGWGTPNDRWPRLRKDETQVLERLHPSDWRQIVADATALRNQILTEAGLIDLGWRLAINQAGDDDGGGGLTPHQLTEVTGLGRHAIYRMRPDEAKGTKTRAADDTAILTEARDKTKRKGA